MGAQTLVTAKRMPASYLQFNVFAAVGIWAFGASASLALAAPAPSRTRIPPLSDEAYVKVVSVDASGEELIGGFFFSHSNDTELTRQLWNSHSAAFDGKDWDNVRTGSPYRLVILDWEGKRLILKSMHPFSKGDAPKPVDPDFVKKREAFDAIVAACYRDQEASALSMQKAIQWQKERAREWETRKRFQYVWGFIWILIVSLPWSGIMWGFIREIQARNRAAWAWVWPALFLSPAGWLAAVNMKSMTMRLIGLTLLAPLLCWALARLIPLGEKPAGEGKFARGALLAAILGYGWWSALSAVTFIGYSLAAGSNEKSMYGNLGAVRSALSIYYGDTEGQYPRRVDENLIPKYMDKLPQTAALFREGRILHLPTNRVSHVQSAEAQDRDGWAYVDDPSSPDFGTFFINCTHLDLRGEKPLSKH